MEASSTSGGRIGGKWSSGAFGGRRAGIYIAVIAALLAGVLIYAFVQHYKKNNSSAAPTVNSVIVATSYIPRGTPASVVAQANGYKRLNLKSGAAVAGAISDPSQINGLVAATNIAPGQELTSSDFAGGTIALSQYLQGPNRALEIPVDTTHGLAGYVTQGERIDLATNIGGGSKSNSLDMLATNVLVLGVGSGGGSLVLQLPAQEALKVGYASDNGRIWVFMRPTAVGNQNKVGT